MNNYEEELVALCQDVIDNFPPEYVENCINNLHVVKTGNGEFKGCPNEFGLDCTDELFLCHGEAEERSVECQNCWKKALGKSDINDKQGKIN